MPIMELYSDIFRNNTHKISKIEALLLEANFFARIYEEFIVMFKNQYRSYLNLIKIEAHMENEMIEANLLRYFVTDILSTNEYTLEGIANVIRMPIDALLEIVSGININPSFVLATKIIKLHSDVRKDLYNELMKRIISEVA